mmetsp:Transcript_8194/g.17909  ORF Transcript_8194/g.17909 Transcript_8194/m.17909 type:complete len:85 (-) Transcript_8194:43-297(-)
MARGSPVRLSLTRETTPKLPLPSTLLVSEKASAVSALVSTKLARNVKGPLRESAVSLLESDRKPVRLRLDARLDARLRRMARGP